VRVVSLLPSATEIVTALGRYDELVGVTFECDEPPEARTEKAVVVGGRDTRGMTPAAIDDYVHTTMAAGEDLYTLHAGALAGLAADVVITQDLCRVCAIPSGQVGDALERLGCDGADVVSLDPYTLVDVLQTIVTVGERISASLEAVRLVADLRGRLDALRAATAGLPRPRVAMIEWVDPPFRAGHWLPDLVRAAGGEPVAANAGARSTQMSWAELAAARPDVVIVAPCGFHLDGAIEQAKLVADRIPQAQLWAIDADGLVVRPGPRVVAGAEAIGAILHPDAVPAPPPGTVARIR
jgi:iron complex transport system substrate-binding protein